MAFDLGGINWLAVAIGTVVYFLLGAVWFAPVTPIGKAWVKAADYESPTGGAMSSNAFYVIPLVTCLVMVIALALLAEAIGVDTLGEGIALGLVGRSGDCRAAPAHHGGLRVQEASAVDVGRHRRHLPRHRPAHRRRDHRPPRLGHRSAADVGF